MKASRASRLFLVAAVVAGPGALSAQGFGLNEIGSCAIGRAFATTASPCRDASAIYWNPATTTALTGWSVVAGVTSISLKGDFKQDTTGRSWDADVPTQWVPHVFVNYHPTNGKFAIGVGAYVPYGLTSQWTDSFPGRFSAKKATLQDLYIQPNVAWQINPDWSIGGGPIYGHSSVELIQAIDLSTVPLPTGGTFGLLGIPTGTEFARARLKGSASGWGAQVAIAGQFNKTWFVGARYLTAINFKYDDADATFTQVPTGLTVGGTLQPPFVAGTPVDAIVAPQFASGGALVAQKVATEIKNPAQFQAGIGYAGLKNWLLEADYQWVGWSSFESLPINFQGLANIENRTLIEDYTNTSGIRLGAEYTIPTDGWKLRAGFAAAQAAAPDVTVTPLLPDQDRQYGTFGIGTPLWNKMLSLDASYAHVFTPGRRGRIAERSNVSNTSATAAQLNTGVFDLSANIFSITLKANF